MYVIMLSVREQERAEGLSTVLSSDGPESLLGKSGVEYIESGTTPDEALRRHELQPAASTTSGTTQGRYDSRFDFESASFYDPAGS
jgi:hypothetical protein